MMKKLFMLPVLSWILNNIGTLEKNQKETSPTKFLTTPIKPTNYIIQHSCTLLSLCYYCMPLSIDLCTSLHKGIVYIKLCFLNKVGDFMIIIISRVESFTEIDYARLHMTSGIQ